MLPASVTNTLPLTIICGYSVVVDTRYGAGTHFVYSLSIFVLIATYMHMLLQPHSVSHILHWFGKIFQVDSH